MAYDIGPKIGLEGEKEFKQAISAINKDMAVLGSEMAKVTAQFGNNAESMEALKAKSEVYNKQIEEQKKKIETLKAALENSAKEYGENDTKTKNWQISLNKAEAELAKTENTLKDTTDKLNKYGNEADNTGNEVEKAGNKAKESGNDAQKGESGWSKLGNGLSKVGDMAGKAMAAMGTAAVGAVTAIGGMTVKAAESADEINTLAKQTGLSTEQIQKFQFASEQIDVSMDTLTGSMAKLTKNMGTAQKGTGDAAKAFEALGISITDSNGELRNNQDVFNETINALGKMENETQRDAYAMQIFGRSAQDLNPLILGGADALLELGEQAEKAGLILEQDALDNINSVADAIDTFKATAKGSGSLFATAFAKPIAKGVDTVTGYIQELTAAFSEGGFAALSDKAGEIISNMVVKINESLPQILEFGLNIITKIIEGISQNLPLVMESVVQILMMLTDSFLSMLPQILDMGMEVILQLALGIAAALPELIPTIVDTVMTIVETLIDNIDMLIEASIAIIIALAEGLIDALPKLIEKIPEIVDKLIEAIIDNLPLIIDAGIKITVAVAKGLIEAIPQLIQAVPKLIQSIVDGFVNGMIAIIEIGKNIVRGIWEGILAMGEWIREKVSGFFGGIVDGVKGVLGIQSPSKVFAGIGENMAAGIGVGFENQMDKVAKTINSSIPKTIGDINISAKGTTGMGVNQIVNIYSPTPLKPSQIARESKNALRRMAWA